MEVKQVEDKDGSVVIEGYASTPDIDRYQDIVEPTAFSKAIEMYMKNPVLLCQYRLLFVIPAKAGIHFSLK